MNTITQKQFNAMFFLAFLAMNFLTFPSRLAQFTRTNGLISLAITCALAYLGIMAIIKVVNRFKGLSYNQVLTKIFGKRLSKVVIFFYLINMAYLCAYSVRLLSEQLNIYMLKETVIFPIETVFLLEAVLLALKKTKTSGNFAQLLYKGIAFVAVYILAMSFPSGRLDNMLPLFNVSLTEIAKGTFAMSAYLFSAVCALPVYISKVVDFDEKKACRDMALVVGAVFVIYAAYYVLCITVLGEVLTAKYVFPALCVIQSVKYENVFMQRYEILQLVMVTTLYFVYVSLMINAAGELVYGNNERKAKKAIVVFSVVVFGIVMFFNDLNVGTVVMKYLDLNNATLPHNFLITVLTIGYAIYRKKQRNGSKKC